MGIEFKKPLIIGDIDASVKTDISQLQQDIGDLSQLDTADKSSLVNALNEAMDSTLNGASRDLDNLSDEGNDKLRSLNAYANEGELLTDADGLSFVKNYAHSTFDLSKFTVVGSPNITDDGIASGFRSSNYLVPNITSISNIKNFSFECLVNCDVLGTTTGTIIQTRKSGGAVGFQVLQEDSALTLNLLADDGTVICDGSEYGTFISNPVINTNYKLKFEIINGDTLKLYCNDVLVSTKNDFGTKTFEFFTINTGIGIRKSNSDRPFNGSIDLKQFSIIVDGVEVFSGNKTGIDTIKPDNYTVSGTPTISADGIANTDLNTNYIAIANGGALIAGKSWKIQNLAYIPGYTASWDILNFTDYNVWYFHSDWNALYNAFYTSDGILFNVIIEDFSNVMNNATGWFIFELKHDINTGEYTVNVKDLEENIVATNTRIFVGYEIRDLANKPINLINNAYDLNAFKIYVDDNLVYQPCLKIPYTESKTGSKIVDSIYRDRVNDMANQFGFAPYYTLSDTDFTLPQGEVYGLIGQRTLRDSYRNGINYWELYSNRDLEQGGSCTSGVEVTFARPFADTNYVLSVPYSAKSATAFTPTQTGDWIAKGKGIL